jgi:hypothetical protein
LLTRSAAYFGVGVAEVVLAVGIGGVVMILLAGGPQIIPVIHVR